MEKRYITIGKNIKLFREKFNYTQNEIADYLKFKDRAIISYYEKGERKIPLESLTKLADLYGIELEDFFTEEPKEQLLNKVFAFRKEELKPNDYNEIAKFNKIVKNYLKLKKLEKKHNVKA